MRSARASSAGADRKAPSLRWPAAGAGGATAFSVAMNQPREAPKRAT